MSSLWTPGGERPIPRASQPVPAQAFDVGGADDGPHTEADPTPEELAAMNEELRAMTEEIVSVPASAVVTNHCVGLFQLALAHLQTSPPHLGDARLAIDAMAAVVEGLRGRLGEDEPVLVDALAQIRLIYVQISAAAPGA